LSYSRKAPWHQRQSGTERSSTGSSGPSAIVLCLKSAAAGGDPIKVVAYGRPNRRLETKCDTAPSAKKIGQPIQRLADVVASTKLPFRVCPSNIFRTADIDAKDVWSLKLQI